MHPVFISYARRTCAEQAQALHEALDRQAFLDTSDIEDGGEFPPALANGVLDARVTVVFADARYFERWYCRREFRLATAPLRAGARDGLRHIVVALQPDAGLARKGRAGALQTGEDSGGALRFAGGPLQDHLPPELRTASWPAASETERLAQLVRERLQECRQTLRERLRTSAQPLMDLLIEESQLPEPRPFGDKPVFRLGVQIPDSLDDQFVGRAADLYQLHDTLTAEPGRAALVGALTAGGGFGKTQMATEYARRYGPHYPGGIFWIDADQGNLEEQFHGVLRTLQPDTPALRVFREEPGRLQQDLGTALRRAGSQTLFIVDNIPEPESGAKLHPVSDYCPAMGDVTVLATSRIRPAEPGVKMLEVKPLSLDAAALLLLPSLDRAGELTPAEWRTVAEWVGRLPLALSLIKAALQDGAYTAKWLCEMAQADAPLSTTQSLAAVSRSIRLSLHKLSPDAVALASILAELAPAPIPEAIMTALGEQSAQFNAEDVRRTLHQRHIVTRAAEVPGGVVVAFGEMHRTVADALREQSGAARPIWFPLAAAALAAALPGDVELPDNWPLLNACLPHGRRLLKGVLRHLHEPDAKADAGDPATTAVLRSANNLALTLLQQGDLGGARELQQQVLEAMRRLLGPEHPDTLTAMGNLAGTLVALGEMDTALQLMRECVAGLRRKLGEQHPNTVAAAQFLAMLEAAPDLVRRILAQSRAAGGQ